MTSIPNPKARKPTIHPTGKTLRLHWYYNGNQEKMSVGVADDPIGRTLAEQKALEIQRDLISGHYDETKLKYKPRKLGKNPTEVTAVELFQKYTKHRLKERELSHSSKVRLDGIASKLSQLLGDKPAEKVTEAVARDAIARWSESASSRTIKERLFDLKACWEWAKGKYHLADPNPWLACLDRLKQRGNCNKPKQRDPFSISELEAIISAFARHPKHSHYTDFAILLVNTSCRPGEVVGLQWQHIGADYSTAWIGESISRGHRNHKGTKTGESRTIRIPPTARTMLKTRFERLNPQPEDLVFFTPKGMAINDNNFRNRIWKEILASCQIKYRPPYNLRHSATSHALRNGADPVALAKQNGHSVKTLMSTYAHEIDRKCLFVDISVKNHP